ncbi:MAG: peptide MFS transporter [Gemmatimonadales bacterium]
MTTLPPQTGFFGHPAGLRTLFLAEMWERFSYYGMRALLVLFMTAPVEAGGLGWPVVKAGAIYGVYTAMVYMLSLPGGWIADRIIGQRKAVFWGGVVIMLGHIALAIPVENFFFIGLGLVVVGTGLLKPNISTIVGQLYAPEDMRRDGGFSIFYMGINLGGFAAPLVTAYLAQSPGFKATLAGWGIAPHNSWHWGFGAAAVGMAFGLIWYVVDAKAMGEAGLHPAPVSGPEEHAQLRRLLWRGVGIVVGVLVLLGVLNAVGLIEITATKVNTWFGALLLLTVVAFFAWLFLAAKWTPEERKRLIVIAVLFLGAAVFWSVFEQAGSTLNLFADRSTNNVAFGKPFQSGMWQSVNSLWIILLAPVFGWIWVKMGAKNPSSPAKFAFGLLMVSISFAWMVPAAKMATGGNRVGWWFLLICYFLQTVGELCLSPVGLSAMTKLAPARVASLMMGVWFLATSVGNYIGGNVASLYESFELPTLFTAIAVYALIFAVVLAFLVRPINRMLARG